MTMTMTMTMTMSTFPSSYWDPGLRFNLELIEFLKAVDLDAMQIGEPPPPDEVADELKELMALQHDKTLREERHEAIHREAEGLIPEFHRILMFSPESHPGTYRLMNAMNQVGQIGVMYFKDKYSRPRPGQLEPELRPMIDVPRHPAYPSGHSTQAHLVAQAMATIVRNPDVGIELFKVAHDIAYNREIAGVHYRSDSEAGKRLARELFVYAEEHMEETFQSASAEWL